MKFSSLQDIDAPLAFVSQVLTDFDWWERAAMRRGAEIGRTDKLREPGPGMAWLARFIYRGKERAVAIRYLAKDTAGLLMFSCDSTAIGAEAKLDLLAISARYTRLQVTLDVKAKTLGARLFLHSLRLARNRVDRSFNTRIAVLAADIEARYRAAPDRATGRR